MRSRQETQLFIRLFVNYLLIGAVDESCWKITKWKMEKQNKSASSKELHGVVPV